MARIKLGLSGINVSDSLAKAVHVITQMTGKPVFATPTPPLSDVQAAVDALTAAAEAAANGDSVKIATRNLRKSELLSLLRRLGAYVQSISGGDEEIILSSGFEVVEEGNPKPPLVPASNVTAVVSDEVGSIEVTWNKLDGARSYVVEMNGSDPLNETLWAPVGYTTAAKFTKGGLQTGHVYWFRVRGIGPRGLGPPSDPAKSVAP